MVSYPRFAIVLMIGLFFALTVSITTTAAEENTNQVQRLLRRLAVNDSQECEFPGNYCETCINCIYDSQLDLLTCKCADSYGNYYGRSSIYPSTCASGIQNYNGWLVCIHQE